MIFFMKSLCQSELKIKISSYKMVVNRLYYNEKCYGKNVSFYYRKIDKKQKILIKWNFFRKLNFYIDFLLTKNVMGKM